MSELPGFNIVILASARFNWSLSPYEKFDDDGDIYFRGKWSLKLKDFFNAALATIC